MDPLAAPEDDAGSARRDAPAGGGPSFDTGGDPEPAAGDDDVPADAGMAELLARALEEHRAGTSSAAALVKQLGERRSGSGPVNGRGRGDDPTNGRHSG